MLFTQSSCELYEYVTFRASFKLFDELERATDTRAVGEQVSLEPRSEKTGLRGFRPGLTQTGLYSHRMWLEA